MASRARLGARNGARVARDRLEDWSYLDDESGTAEGIGPLDGHRIAVAGLMSQRHLPLSIPSGWSLDVEPGQVTVSKPSGPTQVVHEKEEIRVCGFGHIGEVWVLATPSNLDLYRLTETGAQAPYRFCSAGYPRRD